MDDLKNNIRAALGEPFELEQVYRTAAASGQEAGFRDAIADLLEESPTELLRIWAYRLDLKPLDEAAETSDNRKWTTALAVGAGIGVVFAFLSAGRPPVPVPGEANPGFWIGWGPLTAIGILAWLGLSDRSPDRRLWYLRVGAVAGLIFLLAALMAWSRADHVADLMAIHLPFLSWALVCGAVVGGRPESARHSYAFLVKSAETLLTAGIYMAGGMLFAALTAGIFAALGIRLSIGLFQTYAAVCLGVVPLLAVATVYDPAQPPLLQNWSTGLARILRILTQLLLPLAHLVLIVYVVWFLPTYFHRPTEERQVLIVYNATLIAILALLACIISQSNSRSARQDLVLRYGILSTIFLTVILNAYALAAVLVRTGAFGLTPNRHAVIGWNAVTLFMFIFIGANTWLAKQEDWSGVLRRSVAAAMVPAVAWAGWVALVLPLF